MKNFFTPAICLAVVGPINLPGYRPGTSGLAIYWRMGYQIIYVVAPWLAGAALGGLCGVRDLWSALGLVPLMINNMTVLATT